MGLRPFRLAPADDAEAVSIDDLYAARRALAAVLDVPTSEFYDGTINQDSHLFPWDRLRIAEVDGRMRQLCLLGIDSPQFVLRRKSMKEVLAALQSTRMRVVMLASRTAQRSSRVPGTAA